MRPLAWKTAGEFPKWAGDDCANGHSCQDIHCNELERRSINAPKYSLLKRETALIMTTGCTSLNFTGHYKCLHLPLLLGSWFWLPNFCVDQNPNLAVKQLVYLHFDSKVGINCRAHVGLSKEFGIYKLLYINEIFSPKSRIPMRPMCIFFNPKSVLWWGCWGFFWQRSNAPKIDTWKIKLHEKNYSKISPGITNMAYIWIKWGSNLCPNHRWGRC